LPRIAPGGEQPEALLDENDGRAPHERLRLIRIFEDLRGLGYGAATRPSGAMAIAWREKRERDGAGRGLSIRLESRGRTDWRRDDDTEGRACPALPQPDDVRARLSSREPGDGVLRRHPRSVLLGAPVSRKVLMNHIRVEPVEAR
jgi:hypothetical protein